MNTELTAPLEPGRDVVAGGGVLIALTASSFLWAAVLLLLN